MVLLGHLSGASPAFTGAYAVSRDGSVIAGTTVSPGITAQAFRWVAGAGMEGIGELEGAELGSGASGISADGRVIVGASYSANGREAFRWVEGAGMTGLGDFPDGDFYSIAKGVSGDGEIVVGYGRRESGDEAFLWSSQTGLIGLGDLPGGDHFSRAAAVSANGAVVVGSSRTGTRTEAFRWTADTGMVGLGALEGTTFNSVATDVSGDGSVVVGYSASTSLGRAPFIWDTQNGLQSLVEILVNLGADFTGWMQIEPRCVSDNGRVIAGSGINPDGNFEAWVAYLPPSDTTAPLKISGFSEFVVPGQFIMTYQASPGLPLSVESSASGDDWVSVGQIEPSSVRGNTIRLPRFPNDERRFWRLKEVRP